LKPSSFPHLDLYNHSQSKAYHEALGPSQTVRFLSNNRPTPDGEHRTTSLHNLRAIERVILPPEVLRDGKNLSDWHFTIDKLDADTLVRSDSLAHPSTPVTDLLPGSRLCRIRCVQVETSLPSQNEWVVLNHVWPDRIALTLNGHGLEIPTMFEKDVPVYATTYIKEGINNVQAAVFGSLKGSRYVVGIEIIAVMDEHAAKRSSTLLSWKEGRDRILDRIVDSEPDVLISDSQMDLDLTDPITTRLFSTPVRGIACSHNSCFDHEIFLQTRKGKDPDGFKCPICGLDARPPSLVVDGFFLQVRNELERRDRLDAKAITIDKGGDWVIKEMDKKHARRQVIEIDDD